MKAPAGVKERLPVGSLGSKAAYGAWFCIVLPCLLAAWAWATSEWVQIPVLARAGLGAPLAGLGLVLMAWGMLDLWRRGGGLPMNAFPPERLVTGGIYRWLSQPIYVAAVLVSAGISIACQSPSGLWLVTPTLALAAAALTWGYERQDLLARFGTLPEPLLGLPPRSGSAPTLGRRMGTLGFILGLWLLLFIATTSLPAPPDAVSAYFSLEFGWRLQPWTEAIYASAYVAVPLAFFAPASAALFRRFAVAGLWAIGIIGLLWWTLPIVAAPRGLEGLGDGYWVRWMRLERAYDDAAGVGAFPSFHVTWAFLAASALRGRQAWLRALAWLWAALVAISCVTTGMHAAIDVVAGAFVFVLVDRRAGLWEVIRRGSERLANAWAEWRLGPVRVINHGLFGAVGALIGGLVVMALLGDEGALDLWILGVSSIVTAGLWAQIIEGESVSLRPFGYYGAVVGFVIGGGVLVLIGRGVMGPWGAFAVASPWIQALGRCRCLIQGCCHGKPCSGAAGIRVHHPRSRVVSLAGLGGQSVYPTQTYSILWNVVCGLVLYRLWSLAVPASALVGAYLMLAGVGRFVEESYRGEPQTPRVLGLPIYQWNATISFAAGIGFTVWPGAALLRGSGLSALGAGHAIGLGLLVGCLMGVDFPESRRRFGRLTK
ncbi:MAG: membrane-associated phospholipid phosphatase/protein-S-isoprenylcysteine O-methyltransferase Ste14 [Planctomycetota bacterium]|jgi:membrane-associated phospholipid phosphatase/protein-S-isoprenylcysteine O-methyltransferase Ste14